MPSVISEIRRWANTLPYWEQAALYKILKGAQWTDTDDDELLKYLLEDAGLAKSDGKPRPKLYVDSTGSDFESPASQVRLVKMYNIDKVNALVPNQTLTFGPALTAIFGANASGKSGYARVLGCAGFTRGDKHVLPDITRPASGPAILTADIEITDGTTASVIEYKIGAECRHLRSLYVFDSTSVQAHLTGRHTFSFSPAGLSYLTKLAEVTDRVRECLKARINQCTQPPLFELYFQGKSVVTELIANLGPQSDLQELSKQAMLTEEEKGRIPELKLKIAGLRARDVQTRLNELDRNVEDLVKLTTHLQEAKSKLDDDSMKALTEVSNLFIESKSAAQSMHIDQFRCECFSETGSDVWVDFIRAAKSLAEAEQARDGLYPQADDRCLLCYQPLTSEACDHLRQLWKFLEGEAQEKLQKATRVLEKKRTELIAVDLDFFGHESGSYRYLQDHERELAKQVGKFIGPCAERRKTALAILESRVPEKVVEIPKEDPTSYIKAIIQTLRRQREQIATQDPTQEIAELEQQLLLLEHRERLAQLLPQINEYVQKASWAQQASMVGGSTRHITMKYDELFARLVTHRYVELFEGTLRQLGRNLTVQIRTAPRKGETYKQIALQPEPAQVVEDATPEKVLSEGEKRAVALADFLTEVRLDTSSNGIVLDDPVTSLDLEWREDVASLLAAEAQKRQVIVFTHDLPFLHFLKKHTQVNHVDIVTHWIKRGDFDDKPGYVFLDNSPALERDYRSAEKAREFHAQAKAASAQEQEHLLRQGFGALRAAYEAFIIFDLFKGVVMRFEERISFGRLKEITWDKSIADEVITRCECLSRYIEGHLHSDTFAAKKPSPTTLMEEIKAFEDLRRRLRKAN